MLNSCLRQFHRGRKCLASFLSLPYSGICTAVAYIVLCQQYSQEFAVNSSSLLLVFLLEELAANEAWGHYRRQRRRKQLGKYILYCHQSKTLGLHYGRGKRHRIRNGRLYFVGLFHYESTREHFYFMFISCRLLTETSIRDGRIRILLRAVLAEVKHGLHRVRHISDPLQ